MDMLSISLAKTFSQPDKIEAMDRAPLPAPKSTTRLFATTLGKSIIYLHKTCPPGQNIAQYGS